MFNNTNNTQTDFFDGLNTTSKVEVKFKNEANELLYKIKNKKFAKLDKNTKICYEIKPEDTKDIRNKLDNLRELYGGKLQHEIEKSIVMLDGTIPIMTIEDYAKEIKEKLQNGVQTFKNLNRYYIDMEGNLTIGNLILFDANRYYVVNECYVNGICMDIKYYDFEEMLKQFEGGL